MRSPGVAGRCAALLLALALAAACSETPEDIVRKAQQASADEDEATYLGCFSERSAQLLKGLLEADDQSRGDVQYLPRREIARLVPQGEVGAAEVDGDLALVPVETNSREVVKLVLLRELDGWRIDVLDATSFWAPLTRRGE